MEEIQGMSDAEKEIMEIIWNSGGSIYIAELLEKAEENGRGWKRTTIRTFITRLMEKGFIISTRRGRMSEYTAAVTREEYLSGIFRRQCQASAHLPVWSGAAGLRSGG